MMATEDKIDDIIKRVRSNYGDGKAQRGSEEPPVRRISTQSPELDYATGNGIPIGRWSRFYGGPSSGKSTKCWHVAAEAQKMGMVVAYYNAEKQFTAEFAEKQGVDTDKLILFQGTVIEDIGEIMEGTMADIDMHIIDSCSSCVSRVELADGLNEREYMAIRPRKWAQQFAFVNERFDQTRNTVILVDQVRTKIGGGPVTVFEPPGGKYMEHVSSMTIEFKRGSYLWYDKDGYLDTTRNTKQKTLSGGSEADGIEMQAKVVKSRVCRPLRTARMKFDLNLLEFDHVDELVKAAKYFKVVEVSGGWVKVPGEDASIRPRELRERLETDASLKRTVLDAILNQNAEPSTIPT
jgi:RecA/RadA recombinase